LWRNFSFFTCLLDRGRFIFQNRRLILARKIVIEWRFHVFGFIR
jgi:hypothetical protein